MNNKNKFIKFVTSGFRKYFAACLSTPDITEDWMGDNWDGEPIIFANEQKFYLYNEKLI